MDLSWSAGDRVSGRYMARDRMSSDVGISWCRCSSSHCGRGVQDPDSPAGLSPYTCDQQQGLWPCSVPPCPGPAGGGKEGDRWQLLQQDLSR